MDEDFRLLDEYAATGSHAAFDALVRRHAAMIYGTARRRVGSADLADDVTQATFIVLARKAKSIGRRESLSAWLYRVARYAAMDAIRRRSTRSRHERAAARAEATVAGVDDGLAEQLDAALDALPRREREAVLLRFFDDRTLAEVGRAQGVAESTAQRRVERSLERLGRDLRRRGVALTPAAIAAGLVALAQSPAPASATVGVTSLATATGQLTSTAAGAAGLAKGAMHMMTMATIKTAVAATVAATVTVGVGGAAISTAFAQVGGETPAAAPSTVPATPPTAVPTAPAADLARQLAIDWEAVQLSVTQRNPQLAEALGQPGDRDASANLQMNVRVLDATNLIGFEFINAVHLTRLVDDAERELPSLLRAEAGGQRTYYPLRYQMKPAGEEGWELAPLRATASFQLSEAMPPRFSRVEGYVGALTCDRVEHVDVPFEASDRWTAVKPGTRVRFTQAERTETGYRFAMVQERPANAPRTPGNFEGGRVADGRPLPERIVVGMELVDAQGQLIGGRPSEAFFTDSFDRNGSGSGSPGRGAIAAMRYTIAVNPREVRVPFVLTDVELPRLP